MSVAAKAETRALSDAEVVEAYLTASMIPDPDAAAAYMKPGTVITFTGGREFDHPRGPTGFNARRYRWVKKKMDRFDVCPGADETVVYSIGTLYGEWIDGTPFEGNRYVDRFVVQGRPDREDGCLERQRRADSGSARDRGVRSRAAIILRPAHGSRACPGRSTILACGFATPCVRCRASPAMTKPVYRALHHLRHFHHALAVAFLGIGRQNIQQIAAALRRRAPPAPGWRRNPDGCASGSSPCFRRP